METQALSPALSAKSSPRHGFLTHRGPIIITADVMNNRCSSDESFIFFVAICLTLKKLLLISLQFSSYEKADEIKAFFVTNSHPAIDRTVSQSIERVRIIAQWVNYVREEGGIVELVKKLAADSN